MVTATSRAASSSQGKYSHFIHQSVMTEESVRYLLTDPSGIYVDATLGAGGHTMALLQAMGLQGRLLGIDRDDRAIANFRRCGKGRDPRIILFHSSFSLLKELLHNQDLSAVDGVLFDVGLASFQIDNVQRGFSYLHDGPLDMRMDTTQEKTAGDVVNQYDEDALAMIIRDYGQERRWRRIARAIVMAREKGTIDSTHQLADIIRAVVPSHQAVKTLARTYQALRIEVNGELDELRRGLEAAVEVLKPGGRVVTLCYQSLEDRIVKEVFARFSGVCRCPRELPKCVCGARAVIKVLTKKALRPSAIEVARNSRSRSARLRAAEKLLPTTDDGKNAEK